MLKYSVKLTEKDFKGNNIVWREKYVAPDLSYISGVTDFSCHLEKHPYITVESPIANQSNILRVESEVVTRTGYVVLKEKEYPVKEVEGKDYVHINGRFFYGNGSSFTIKDWQKETFVRKDGKIVPKIVEEDKTVTASGGKIKLDTIYWIEDGYVTIDGNQYIFDPNEQQSNGTVGCLKFTNDGKIIDKPCPCKTVYLAPYTDVSLIHEVCKFKAYSTPYISYKFTDMKFCEYFFFAKYKEYYCPVRLKGSNFVCEVPLGGDISSLTDYQVYAHDDSGDEFVVNTSVSGVKGINDLLPLNMFIKLENQEFPINYDYRASNSSKYIMVRMENQMISVPVGETISFVDTSYSCAINVENGTILYDGKKYYVEEGLFKKAVIDGTEYDVVYDDLDTSIAYVTIEGEQVPMMLDGDTLTRYGYVLKKNASTISEEKYTVNRYSGVTIDGVAYIVKDNVAYIGQSNKIKFIVTDVKGNSLYICTPYFNPNEYTDYTYINNKAFELCFNVVGSKDSLDFQVNNKVFGPETISKESAFGYSDNPTSSDNVYDIFNRLKINGDNSYVNLPITFTSARSNNILQSDTIKKDFCEKEKEKAINKIVDLEKDVYSPKILLDDNYNGSNSNFQSVHTINVNLHFRTRNLENWKVNEGYNDVSVSGTADNWFITDYEPYKTMISADTTTELQLDTLMNTSDLLGFLNFDNNDVFYQKSRISKSFLRFTFYDSCDPQTQSLLATSSVFLNENDLYKKYIDNSRKGVHDYLQFALNMDETIIANKIRVTTERLATRREQEASPTDIINVKRPNDETQELEDIYVSLKEDARLSSRLVIDNKYSTDTSSEGFYIYMFREYAEKLHPKPIYMKIEFNHAGIGKTIPFIVPMRWESGETNSEEDEKIPNIVNVYPRTRVTLSSKTKTEQSQEQGQGEETPTVLSDLDYLKQGYPLSWVYAQSYIPLYAVYDFKNKEYGYVFDNRYVTNNNGVINLNLFEIKIRNDEDYNTKEGTAIIDINEQFS